MNKPIFLMREIPRQLVTGVQLILAITKEIKIPTIGIGSSSYCDGQILVTDDILGLTDSKSKFVKKFINIKTYIRKGVKKFRYQVINNKYPSKKYWY